MIKTRDLRTLDEVELAGKLRELKEELFNLRFQHATGQLDNPMKIKEAKRDIARVCTVITERRFSIHPEAFEEAGEGLAMEALEEPEELVEVESEAELEKDELEVEPAVYESEEQLEEEVEEELKDL